MGIDLCRFGLCASAAKGLRRASATEAIAEIVGASAMLRSCVLGCATRAGPPLGSGRGCLFYFFIFFSNAGALAGLALICASILYGQRFQMCLAVNHQ
jgi:hypothetical protein